MKQKYIISLVIFLIGVWIGMLIIMLLQDDITNQSNLLKLECEKDLPRSQICIMQYIPTQVITP